MLPGASCATICAPIKLTPPSHLQLPFLLLLQYHLLLPYHSALHCFLCVMQYGFANADLVRQRREELQLLLPPPRLTLTDDPAATPFHLCGVRDYCRRQNSATNKDSSSNSSRTHVNASKRIKSLLGSSDSVGIKNSFGEAEVDGPASGLQPGAAGGTSYLGMYGSTAGGMAASTAGAAECLYVRGSTQVFGQAVREQCGRYDKRHRIDELLRMIGGGSHVNI